MSNLVEHGTFVQGVAFGMGAAMLGCLVASAFIWWVERQ